MTDYGDIPRDTLTSILNAPTLFQALRRALKALANSQESIEAMSRTMEALEEQITIGEFVESMPLYMSIHHNDIGFAVRQIKSTWPDVNIVEDTLYAAICAYQEAMVRLA